MDILASLCRLIGRWLPRERRGAPRYFDGTDVELDMALHRFEGRLIDVSTTGACLAAREAVDVGRSVLVRIPWDGGCAHLLLVVRWVAAQQGEVLFGATPDPRYAFSRSLLERHVERVVASGRMLEAA